MHEQHATLEQLVDRCGQLYSLPTVAVRVLALTESPTVDARALKDCIENDPALTGKILRVVNSSLFGLSREVTDLTQAIGLLGINPLKLLVLGFSLPDRLFVGLNGDILRRYWHRTLVKAVAAREISQTLLDRSGDEAFIAGLLQDIGALVLLQEMGESYARLYGNASATSTSIAETERATLGFDHVTLSARLLERWRLPGQLVAAVEAAPNRDQILQLPPEVRPLAEVLQLADLVASLLVENRTDLLADLLDRAREGLALRHTQLAALVATLSDKVKNLADVLKLELPAGQDYQAILIEAHARLSEVASEAAVQLLERNASTDGVGTANALPVGRPPRHEATAVRESALALEREQAASQARNRVRVHQAPAPQAATPAFKTRPTSKDDDAGRDPGFVGRVSAAVTMCRQARQSLSLFVVEIDQYEDTLLTRGPSAARRITAALEAECRSLDHPDAIILQSREVQFAIILPACDRRQAVDLANELISRVQRRTLMAPARDAAVLTVSVGVASVALPPKNFPAAELIRAAERCLSGVKLSGGNAVKSIEIY